MAVQVIGTVTLTRLLTPADFGVVTMATTFSLLLTSFGTNGFTEAIIQFEDVDHHTASNLFWINLSIGLMLAVAFAAGGSLLARFYKNPDVATVAVGLSPGILFAAASVIHSALLNRAMQFGATSGIDLIGRIVYTFVPISLATLGWGYWALVAGIVSQQICMTIGVWWLCPWLPSSPRRTGKTSAMIRFAAHVYGRFSIRYSTQNIDNLLIGWRFSTVSLGYYKRAYDLFALSASQVTAPLHNVALAALSRLNQDPARFRRYLINALNIIAFVAMAASAELTLVGKDVVRVVLGPYWSESGRIFELFGPGIGPMLLCTTVGWIHLSIGNPARWLRWTIVELIVTFSLLAGALPWGPRGVAAAWSLSYWALVVPAFSYAGRPNGFRTSFFVRAVWRYVFASLAAGFGTATLMSRMPFWKVSGGVSAALISTLATTVLFFGLYLGAVIVLHGGLAPLRQIMILVREITPFGNMTRPNRETV